MPPPSKKPRKDLKIEVKLQLIEDCERDSKLSFRKLGKLRKLARKFHPRSVYTFENTVHSMTQQRYFTAKKTKLLRSGHL